MSLSLPHNPNLDFLHKQAKAFLKSIRESDPAALSLLQHKQKYRNVSESKIPLSEVTLQEVQHCLSCEYGFTSWRELRTFVECDIQAREKCRAELRHFLDDDGTFKAWPAKYKKQRALIEFLAVKFQPRRMYTEQEVNELLLEYHSFNDPALLRRALVDYGYLDRERDGRRYWKK